DPRGGYPIPYLDALLGGEPVYDRPDARIPAPGSEIAKVDAVAAQLAKAPDLAGLTPLQRSRIANWNQAGERTTTGAASRQAFSVFEKSIAELQDAMTSGVATSEDIVDEYLARIARFDRNGPTFHAILSLNPGALADARAR